MIVVAIGPAHHTVKSPASSICRAEATWVPPAWVMRIVASKSKPGSSIAAGDRATPGGRSASAKLIVTAPPEASRGRMKEKIACCTEPSGQRVLTSAWVAKREPRSTACGAPRISPCTKGRPSRIGTSPPEGARSITAFPGGRPCARAPTDRKRRRCSAASCGGSAMHTLRLGVDLYHRSATTAASYHSPRGARDGQTCTGRDSFAPIRCWRLTVS